MKTNMENINRCAWCGDDPLYVSYHDEEWGVPIYDDQLLFAKLILDGAQAGLSWTTILKKREAYRVAFDRFDRDAVRLNAAIPASLADKAVDQGTLVGIGHDQEVPALGVGARGRLERDIEAFAQYRHFHRLVEIEALTHRAGGGEDFVGVQLQCRHGVFHSVWSAGLTGLGPRHQGTQQSR